MSDRCNDALPILRELHERLAPHERLFAKSLFAVAENRFDARRSSVVRGGGILLANVLSIDDRRAAFVIGFTRPGGQFVFHMTTPGPEFANLDALRDEADAESRAYELDGFLRSKIRVETRVGVNGPVRARVHFDALSYGHSGESHVSAYRWRRAWLERTEVHVREYEPWIDR